MTTGPTSLEELSDWLELELASGSRTERDARMPAVFKDLQNIDRLCESCEAIPWSMIKAKAEQTMEAVVHEIPTVQHQFDSGTYERKFFACRWTTLSSVVTSASNGCHFCSLGLWTLFGQLAPAGFPLSRRRKPATLNIELWTEFSASLKSCDGKTQLFLNFCVHRRTFGSPITLKLQFGHRLSGHSHAALQMAINPWDAPLLTAEMRRTPSTISSGQSWLDHCCRSHRSCARGESPIPPMPKRIIAIDRRNGELHARLCLTTDGERARYAALSHRWSSSRSLLLSTTNIEELRQGISMGNLSQTFREALELVINLGLRYIWIDCLCILQNNQDDWAEQSAEMPAIYSGAHVTIVAYTSPDGTGSCLSSYATNLVEIPCQVTACMFLFPDGDPEDEEGTAKTRAWIMQEEILSRRKIFCGAERPSWTCREMHLVNGKPWVSQVHHQVLLRDSVGQGIMPTDAMEDSARWHWNTLVGDYTLKELTYVKDKLPALSALSRRFGESMSWSDADFFAGIWRQHLPEALLWKRESHRGFADPEERARQESRSKLETAERNSPTWSWSSCDGPISFFHHEPPGGCVIKEYSIDAQCEILDIKATAKTSNVYGEVARGSITMRGPTLYGFQVPEGRQGPGKFVYWDTLKHTAEDYILFQINTEAGIILVEMPGVQDEKQYQRVGVCIASSPLDCIFRGTWETTTITVV